MRRLFFVVGMIYVVGIAVQVWPLLQTQWETVPASHLAASLAERLPAAAAWPARAWERTHAYLAARTNIASR